MLVRSHSPAPLSSHSQLQQQLLLAEIFCETELQGITQILWLDLFLSLKVWVYSEELKLLGQQK